MCTYKLIWSFIKKKKKILESLLRKKGKTLKENSNAVKGFALLFLRQEEAFSWWGMISRIGLNGKNWEREICFYIYIYDSDDLWNKRTFRSIPSYIMYDNHIYIYIYICTGQGPRPVGPWTLALRYNKWPCPRWTYGLDSDTPSSPIWAQKP